MVFRSRRPPAASGVGDMEFGSRRHPLHQELAEEEEVNQKKKEGIAPLSKSRDPHLASGEKTNKAVLLGYSIIVGLLNPIRFISPRVFRVFNVYIYINVFYSKVRGLLLGDSFMELQLPIRLRLHHVEWQLCWNWQLLYARSA
jgi:hypothetical protein